ncbi:MAG: V-type ATP synthase subunit F [Thermoplasmata archaeon]
MDKCITVIGEREIVLGFRLLGVTNTIIAEGEKSAEKFMEIFQKPSCSLIIASEDIKDRLSRKDLRAVESSSRPLVVFIPLPGRKEEESIEEMAKRILGIDIGSV